MGIKGQHFIVKKQFEGLPKTDDFKLITEDLGELEDGEIAYEAEYISVDPYQRAYVKNVELPITMVGSQISKVTQSRDPEFPVGSRLVNYSGWIKVGKFNPKKALEKNPSFASVYKAPDMHGVSPSYLLGSCGMPGHTAYFGFLEICQPKEGETVFVNGAAGAVGSLVGQIAKIKGCKVIGTAGTDEKLTWLREIGFDHAFNYKTDSLADSLKKAAPNGIDCFFDNVGGEASSIVIERMNKFGRISVCGAIASYNEDKAPPAPAIQSPMVFKNLKMEGFTVDRWDGRKVEATIALAQWILEGKIKVKETVVEGFENTPEAFISMLTGGNIGKMIVKV